MANLIDIRRRIRSVKNTQQITKAMKMVAAARLRRSQDRILATRPYALEIRKVISNLASRVGRGKHPLLGKRGSAFFRRRALPMRKAYTSLFTNVTYAEAQEIAADVATAYAGGEY